MSQISYEQNRGSLQSNQTSPFKRPMNKMSSYICQDLFNTQQKSESVVRSSPGNKCKTFAAIDPNNINSQPKYRLNTMNQKKIFVLFSLISEFKKNYQQITNQQQLKLTKVHNDRKRTLNIKKNLQYKVIQPLTVQHLNLQESKQFILKLQSTIKTYFHNSFVNQIKKRKSKVFRMLSREENVIEEYQNQHLREETQKNIMQPNTFITSDCNNFNSTSYSQTVPHTDLMAVSNFPFNNTQLLQNPKILNKGKFHAINPSVKSRIRINPSKNKYQSRKREQIRLFMQLNEKTQHLQNFRSDEGKFFKFNQNLKITIKNINLCRIVLINKKKIIIQQLNRLGDDKYFKQLNQKKLKQNINLEEINNKSLSKQKQAKKVSSRQKNKRNKQQKSNQPVFKQKPMQLFKLFQTLANKQAPPKQQNQIKPQLRQLIPSVYKQKANRIKYYFQEINKFYKSIESFLLQFIKKDKSYQNYQKQNNLKSKLKLYQKHTNTQKYFQDFVDKCFNISEISRLYFNTLSQLTHQNIQFNELRVFNKQDLQINNKLLIQLRYVLIYLQKQCQNTNQSNLFRFTDNNFIKRVISTENVSQLRNKQGFGQFNKNSSAGGQNILGLLLRSTSQHKNLFKQQTNTIQNNPIILNNQTNQSKKINKSQSQKIFNPIMLQTLTNFIQIPSQNTKNNKIYNKNNRNKKYNNKPSRIESEKKPQQMDINQIWKTFYNKKFSSNAMRMRMY